MTPDPASGRPGPRGHGLPKTSRLVHRRDFLRVRDEGRRLASGSVVVNWLDREDLPRETRFPLLGVITTKALGSAVVRNRARRRMREAFRMLRPSMSRPAWVVLIARHSMKDADAPRVARDLTAGLRKARLLPA
ncbi:MAG: ribonuclease P protein component [Verrucomicrobiota bacterium]|jgi:ribonuclease P protein component